MGESRKFNIAEGLSSKFGSASAKWGGLSAVVEAANNFLGGYDVKTEADVQRLLYDAATNPGSLGTSVMVTSHTPNDTPETQKKKDEEAARDALLAELQKQLQEANERISKMIDKCLEMAELCRKQAEKAAEMMEKIATRMAKNSEFINEADELFESYKATGHFDREKAHKMLRERGVKTKDDVSDAKLLELIQKEWTKALKDNTDLSEKYEEQKKEKEKFEARQKELEEKAREFKERQDSINNDEGLSLSEKAEKLKELEEKYSPQILYTAAKLETDNENFEKLRLNTQVAFDESSNIKPEEDKKEVSGFMADFGASANPAKKESALENTIVSTENKPKNPLASV